LTRVNGSEARLAEAREAVAAIGIQAMSYKTILCYLSDKRRAEAILEAATHLAARNSAHLVGCHVFPGVPAAPIPLPFGSEVLKAVAAAQHQETVDIAAIFSRMTVGKGPFTAEWRAEKGPRVDPTAAVLEHGRCADLIVAGQTDPDWESSPLQDIAELLALGSGRPVLVVPYVGRYPAIGRNVVIAWKPGRESARAVFDSLPILKQAEQVQILAVDETGSGDAAAAPIVAALARHGIKAAVRTSATAGDISVGDEILSRLADMGADLLVMGAYGHSRMREWAFGGVTRHIAGHMTVPTLFSH
jgi:nucleotide-binding universal stress UspA family protein